MNEAPELPRGDEAVQIFGIVNITEDSFSDGGRYLEPERAIEHARRLAAGGADVVDLGPASSHPEAVEVSVAEEIRRLAPVVKALRSDRIPVSVDVWRPDTQAWAIEAGVDWINDIRGFDFPDFHARLADADCGLVVMHSMQHDRRASREHWTSLDVMEAVLRFFDRRVDELQRAGVDRRRLVLDPGMGLFLGADPEPSVEILRRIPELRRRYDVPVMVSVSRKSVVGALMGRHGADRTFASLAAELFAVARGAGFIRTHTPEALRDAMAVLGALAQPRT